MSEAGLTACHDCDLLLTVPPAQEGTACCPRCGARLHRYSQPNPEHALALALAGAIVFLLANAFPILTLDARGLKSAATLWQTVQALWLQGKESVSVLVLFTGLMMPALELLGLLGLLLPLHFGRRPPGFVWLMRWMTRLYPWSMLQVFLLGVLVSLVKLVALASVVPGIGLWSFFALIMLTAASAHHFDAAWLWERYRSCATE